MRHADPATLVRLYDTATATWREAELLPLLRDIATGRPGDPLPWQLLALVQRQLDRHNDAARSIARAASLQPHDPLIAHTRARIALEAGLPSLDLFDRALRLAPLDAPTILGRAAAQVAAGDLIVAIDDLAGQLRLHPAWSQGHQSLARLRWQAGDRTGYASSFAEAVAARPTDGALWRDYAAVVLRAGQHDAVLRLTTAARRALGESRTLDLLDATALSEEGRVAAADTLFSRHLPIEDAGHLVSYVRHQLRAHRFDRASAVLEGRLAPDRDHDLWPLASLAWRGTDDPRRHWLEPEGSVGVFDLGEVMGPLDPLADRLRDLHLTRQHPLDQSLRHGTQTDGPLFSRIEPTVRRLRDGILQAVRRYVDALPSFDRSHPMLASRRDTLRFAGSWSVRLVDGGHHVDHVHPAGWISSALYVALPERQQRDAPRAGWLSLGDAPSLGLDFPSIQQIEPKPGRLALFPSTMWHRTLPFSAGERLTVAFDIARPPA